MVFSKIGITFLCGFAGGLVFYLIHMPLPWTLGAVTATIVLKSIHPMQAQWPKWLSDCGLMTVAFMLGRSVTGDMAKAMLKELPGIISAAAFWVLMSFLIGKLFAKAARLDRLNAILGSMPGGMSQMILAAGNLKGADQGTVALIQTSRLIVVLYSVPIMASFIAHSGTEQSGSLIVSAANAQAEWPSIWGFLLIPLVPASAYLFKRFGVPSSEFIGPALVAGVLSALGCPWPAVPSPMLAAAQLFFGIYIGLRVQPGLFLANKRLAPLAFVMALFLVALTAVVAWMLSLTTETDIVTWFLALAPGGIGEMAATAVALHADVVKVTAYQTFRLFVIVLIALPALKKIVARANGKSDAEGSISSIGK